MDLSRFLLLLDSCSVRDQVRLCAISHHFCASAWLQAIPSELLGLTLSGQEFVVVLRYWLGIPLYHVSARCSCGVVLDGHGDHILGCGDGPLRIRRHDAICDLLWHALVQDHSGCKKELRCGADLDHSGDVFHPDFKFGKSVYLDVSVRHLIRTVVICMNLLFGLLEVFYFFGGGSFRSLVAQ